MANRKERSLDLFTIVIKSTEHGKPRTRAHVDLSRGLDGDGSPPTEESVTSLVVQIRNARGRPFGRRDRHG